MATNYDYWKVLLRPNLLTKDVDNDYFAEVSTIGHTERRENIAREIVREGSEFKYETVLDILTRADRIICNHIEAGHSVMTGVVHITPRVRGNWYGRNPIYVKEEHKITVDMIPGAELYESLKNVSVEVVGMADAHAFIRTTVDSHTGKENILSPGYDLIIEGGKLKIEPADEAGLGVFLQDAAGGEPLQLEVTQNLPKSLRAHVPADLPQAVYNLYVVTRYSGSTPLKEARTIDYDYTLKFDEEGGANP